MRQLTDKEHQLVMQLFVGMVANIIGFGKCTELIIESKRALGFEDKKTFQERLEELKQEKK